jgi:hypothetical protein
MLSVAAHCQKFLSDSFVLPENNVIIKAALDRLNLDSRETVVNRFKRPAPGTYAHSAETLEQMRRALPKAQTTTTDVWLPIIPLCTEALNRSIPHIERVKMDSAAVDLVANLILARFKAVISLLLSSVPSTPLRLFLTLGQPFIRALARRPLRDALAKQLGDPYQP